MSVKRTPIVVFCQLCREQATVFPGQQMHHAKCPKKGPRAAFPQYVTADKLKGA